MLLEQKLASIAKHIYTMIYNGHKLSVGLEIIYDKHALTHDSHQANNQSDQIECRVVLTKVTATPNSRWWSNWYIAVYYPSHGIGLIYRNNNEVGVNDI